MRPLLKMITCVVAASLSTLSFAQSYQNNQYHYHHHKKHTHPCAVKRHHYSHSAYHSTYSAYKDEPIYKPMISAPKAPSFNGFYIGASIGGNDNYFKFHDALRHNINSGEINPLIEGFAGFGHVFPPYGGYLGAEVYANETLGAATANTTVIDRAGTHVGLQTRESYGVSILPGILVTDDVLGYLRVGAVWTHFYSKVNNIFQNYTNSNRKVGWEAGIGTRVKLIPNLDMRLEYSVSGYRSYYTTVNHYHIRPMSDRVNLGIIYQFG